MLRILISADMEGISGVVDWDQTKPGHPEYERFRRIMTADVNAAVKGSVQTGADDIVVADGHDGGHNILIEELDPRARLNAGRPAPYSMVQGIDDHVSAVMLVGYHARAGSTNGVLNHTWTTGIANLWLNGQLMGEIGLNAALCGHFGATVIVVTGDQAAVSEACDLIPGIEGAVVKQGYSRTAAECLPLDTAHQKIREAAARGISKLRVDMAPPPFRLKPPILVAIEFTQTDMAERAASVPGATRLDSKRVQYSAEDMPAAFQYFKTAASLAG